MNKISKILFCILIALSFSYVKAECTSDEINKLKKEADKIEVTYKHLGGIITDAGIDYGQFEIKIKNIPNDFYVMISDVEEIEKPENNEITTKLYTGKHQIDIYSTKCETKIDEIKVKLPRYNPYSEDPLCDGIDSKKFPLCGKYYENYVSYDQFLIRVKNYRITNNIQTNSKEDVIDQKENHIWKVILKTIVKYKLYIIIGVASIIPISLIVIFINKKKKRGVLK